MNTGRSFRTTVGRIGSVMPCARMSAMMPTTVIHVSAGDPGPMWTSAPRASPLGQNRRAMVSLITTTFGALTVSVGSRSRPATMRAPMSATKFGETDRYATSRRGVLRRVALDRQARHRAAPQRKAHRRRRGRDAGNLSRRAPARRARTAVALRCVRYRAPGKVDLQPGQARAVEPRSRCDRCCTVRISKPAPTSSTSAMATCATTSALRVAVTPASPVLARDDSTCRSAATRRRCAAAAPRSGRSRSRRRCRASTVTRPGRSARGGRGRTADSEPRPAPARRRSRRPRSSQRARGRTCRRVARRTTATRVAPSAARTAIWWRTATACAVDNPAILVADDQQQQQRRRGGGDQRRPRGCQPAPRAAASATHVWPRCICGNRSCSCLENSARKRVDILLGRLRRAARQHGQRAPRPNVREQRRHVDRQPTPRSW